MPQLPPAPECPTPLPAQPQNPPTFIDIANAIDDNRNTRSRCMLQSFSQSLTLTHDFDTVAGGASKDDVARGAICEAAVIEEHAEIGAYIQSYVQLI